MRTTKMRTTKIVRNQDLRSLAATVARVAECATRNQELRNLVCTSRYIYIYIYTHTESESKLSTPLHHSELVSFCSPAELLQHAPRSLQLPRPEMLQESYGHQQLQRP